MRGRSKSLNGWAGEETLLGRSAIRLGKFSDVAFMIVRVLELTNIQTIYPEFEKRSLDRLNDELVHLASVVRARVPGRIDGTF